MRVVDEDGKPCAPDENGHVQVRGPNVFAGYWRMPEKTAEEFTADGFFKTGDMGTFTPEGYVQIVQMGDDLGTQQAPQISPQMYRRFFKPRHRLIYERVRRRPGIHVFLHSCGAIADLLPDLIEAGVEIINPVQTNCRGMEPDGLKADFGRDICFWGGGCDTREVLPRGTPQAVKDHVKRRLDVFMPGGGFVFNTVHNILPEAPPQNIVAMYEAIEEYDG